MTVNRMARYRGQTPDLQSVQDGTARVAIRIVRESTKEVVLTSITRSEANESARKGVDRLQGPGREAVVDSRR